MTEEQELNGYNPGDNGEGEEEEIEEGEPIEDLKNDQ